MRITRWGGRLTLLAAAGGIVAATASAESQSPRTLSLKELERGATFTHVRNTRPPTRNANLMGDQIVFTNPLADRSGAVVGRIHVECVTTKGARNFRRSLLTCSGVMVLRDGTLTLQATSGPADATTTGAVTGGTGAYANARGVFVSREARGGSEDTITLAG